MDQNKSTASAAAPVFVRTLAHWGQLVAFFLSFGFVYPNAMTEGMDTTKIQGNTEGDLYKKKK